MNPTTILQLQSYSFNPFAIAPLLVASISLIFGFFLYFQDTQSQVNRSLLYVYISSAFWLFCCVLILNSKHSPVALFWSHFLYGSFMIVPATLFHLSISLPNKYAQQKYLLYGTYVLAGILTVLCHHVSFLEGVKEYYFGYYPQSGPMQSVTVTFFVLCLCMSLVNLLVHHFSLTDPTERRRTQLFMFCFIIIGFALIDIIASQESYLYPSGFIAFLGFAIGMTCFKLMIYHATIQRHALDLEIEVKEKTKEVTDVIEDLRTTQLKLLETSKRSALASLSSGILHQLSQPVTAIHGFARFMKSEMNPKDTFYKPVCHIEEQSVSIKKILEDLMNLVRHRDIKKESIHINDAVKSAINLLQDELKIHRVDCDLELDDKIPLIFADCIYLQQIFMNIIISSLQSLKMTPKDKRRHFKIISSFDNKEEDVLVTFQDPGRGLSDGDKEALVEPFFSLKSYGSGIDLALCKDLIAEHGGRIDVCEDKKGGSQFTIRIPILKT